MTTELKTDTPTPDPVSPAPEPETSVPSETPEPDTFGGCLELAARFILMLACWFFALFGFVEQPLWLHLFDVVMTLLCLYVVVRILRTTTAPGLK